MNKKVVKLAQQLVKLSKRQLPDKPSYRQICDEVGIGEFRRGKIHLTYCELRKLEHFLDDLLGTTVIDVSLDFDSRFDASLTLSQEKWAKGDVFKSMINMSSSTSYIPLVSGEDIKTSIGTVISVRKEFLDVKRINKLVVIENGEVLVYWEHVIKLLPLEYKDAVIVYRGHGDNQTAVREVIRGLSKETKVLVFYDYDAAGIDMALNLAEIRSIDLLVPKVLSPEVLNLTKSDEYHEQYPQLTKRLQDPETPIRVREHLSKIDAGRLAITQEHLIVHKATLEVIEVMEYQK
ncbi:MULTISPECIES: DUF7281 domain-containing protein [Vibrio]|uniref:DUF7281 domain-containing protein n=1 Tax=Vibrio cidicii TaxID=1763883 RepID=A0A151JK07_9VIBR|nr:MULTISPECIES: hypothetical protein [Vibrio]EHU9520776.1 hypothetical protein [Vibrio vulnificus]MDF5466816.1 hypothetical protein [Vibrio parahaemolyticus]KYN26174.1 hypothetical protein AUQ44_13600 [Vibrio cidicii]MBD1563974.1 hypothetical protein [Vibrio sp. S12_S33]MDE1264563.1 hypothetical protein [Vibrio aestuarianus]